MIDFATWIHAWEGEMRDAGYPNARLNVHRRDDDLRYGWTHDLNKALDPDWKRSDRRYEVRVAAEAAMQCFTLVDDLRPEAVEPAPALRRWLDDRRR